MSRDRVVQTAIRVAALALLLVALLGPWAFDTHPSTQQDCPAPLVWLGGGRCACLVAPLPLLALLLQMDPFGIAGAVWLILLLLLPFLSTPLLLVAERRWPRALHLAAWGLAAAMAAFVFIRHWPLRGVLTLRLWGVWLCLAVSIAALAAEILAPGLRTGNEPETAAAEAG